MRFLASLVTLSILLSTPAVFAQEVDPLAQARELAELQDFGSAREILQEALESGSLDRDSLIETYRLLAESAAALRQPEEAEEAFLYLLALDPDFFVPSAESPLVREPFEQAVAHWEALERPSFTYTPPASIPQDEPFLLTTSFDFESLPSLYSSIQLHFQENDGSFASIVGQGQRLVLPAARLTGLSSLDLYLSIHDEHGNQSAFVGSESSPYRIDFDGEGSGGTEEPGRRRLYQRWWFWTVIGGVILSATAVSLAVVFATRDHDLCTEAFDQSCDFQISVDP